ncbi:MAG: class I SAM-dependent methyltransferase, partial [Myxococcales bacterium]|nr:class I SAM-dependent methyltransferase [Myxococcales bacterium]
LPDAYQFSEDWLTPRLPFWVSLLRERMGEPELRYLEVGVYEGRSLLWMLEHVLTHPTSTAVGIDIRLYAALLANVASSGAAERIELLEDFSQLAMRKLEPESFDIIYIDGSHMSDDVLEDCVLAWRLLAPGGLMILDDYHYEATGDARGGKTPPELTPRVAVDGFISANRRSVAVVHKGYQMALKKLPEACTRGKWPCSSFAGYAYDWRQGLLYRGDEDIELLDAEREVLEELIRSRTGDGLTLRVHRELVSLAAFEKLKERLGLELEPLPPRPGA